MKKATYLGKEYDVPDWANYIKYENYCGEISIVVLEHTHAPGRWEVVGSVSGFPIIDVLTGEEV